MKSSRYLGILTLIGFLMMAGGCSKSSSPTSPTVPVVKHLNIVVTASAETLLIGTTEIFKATATADDGTTTPVTGGTWSSSDWSIATVEASTGRVTIVGNGYVNIGVEYQGNRGGIVICGVADFRGSWSGSYSFVTCNSSGDFSSANWCNNFPTNEVFQANLNLSQNLDTVTGVARFGNFTADVIGAVTGKNELAIMCTVSYGLSTIEVLWMLRSATPGKITGSMVWHCRSTKMSGESQISADIREMNRE